jgi:formylglycine-generating enzyme required for sulfatase activity
MGSPPAEPGRRDNENQRRVVLSRGYYLQTTEVTQGQWKTVMGTNPSRFKDCGDDCPVERVSWNDIQSFIRKLNKRGGNIFHRLPTEAEWEFAARDRGGAHLYAGSNDIDMVAWYSGNSNGRTHPVGLKMPNSLGLYDMSGNVYEWCRDWYGDYAEGTVTDPLGPSSGGHRVLRGGCWYYDERSCRVAVRIIGIPFFRSDTLGFRLAGQ